MAQELKSSLKPYVNYTYVLSSSINYLVVDSQVCFHRELFADPVKSSWCNTGLVEPLRSTNQNLCGVKLLPMSILTYAVDCIHTSMSSTGNLGPMSVNQWQGKSAFSLPTYTHHPSPSYPPTLLYTAPVILQGL